MLSLDIRKCLALAFTIIIAAQTLGMIFAVDTLELTSHAAEVNVPEWREASPIKVIIRSTSDWGRVLFDDLNGTNSNGLRITAVVGTGWLEGEESDDQLYAGPKFAWPDTEYGKIVGRKGDMVAFFKGLNDFHYTEVYADLTLQVNIALPLVYIWLMTGGNGTTSFEFVGRDTGGTIWRDAIVGNGETQQVKRVMSAQPFLKTGRTESDIVVASLLVVILAMIALNFPIPKALRSLLGRRLHRRQANSDQFDRSHREQLGTSG
jgi:hypothetical protein